MSRRTLVQRVVALGLISALPALLLAVGVARFTLVHFFVRPAYLLDSGWLSAVVYRAGVAPPNPDAAFTFAHSYFGVHFSPLLSAFSAASYVQPLPRIEWFALVEAVLYVPIGLAVFAATGSRTGRVLLAATGAAFAFAFSGPVFEFIAYPHFEPAIAGLLCLTLAALVAGHVRAAWVMLALTLSVREDAGVTAACALAPLAYLVWRDRSVRVGLPTIVRMMVVALAWTITAILIQRVGFHGENTLRRVYLGTPAFAHLSVHTVIERARFLLTDRQFVTFPLLATGVLAAARRDPGYLLGWVAATPWFVLNFVAFDPMKSSFNFYTSFPFVISMFWVLVYGAHVAQNERRMSPTTLLVVFAAICVSSTLGHAMGSGSKLSLTFKDMYFHREQDPDAVHAFAEFVGRHRGDLGRWRIDEHSAAVAIERVHAADLWQGGLRDLDAIIFHRDTWWRTAMISDVFANQLDHCVQFIGTSFVLCTRAPLPAALLGGVETRPLSSLFAFSPHERSGLLGNLEAGVYRLRFSVFSSAEVVVRSGRTVLGRSGVSGPGELAIEFTADGARTIAFDLTGPGAFGLASGELRKR